MADPFIRKVCTEVIEFFATANKAVIQLDRSHVTSKCITTCAKEASAHTIKMRNGAQALVKTGDVSFVVQEMKGLIQVVQQASKAILELSYLQEFHGLVEEQCENVCRSVAEFGKFIKTQAVNLNNNTNQQQQSANNHVGAQKESTTTATRTQNEISKSSVANNNQRPLSSINISASAANASSNSSAPPTASVNSSSSSNNNKSEARKTYIVPPIAVKTTTTASTSPPSSSPSTLTANGVNSTQTNKSTGPTTYKPPNLTSTQPNSQLIQSKEAPKQPNAQITTNATKPQSPPPLIQKEPSKQNIQPIQQNKEIIAKQTNSPSKEIPKQITPIQQPKSPVSNTEIDTQAALEDFAGFNEKPKQTTTTAAIKPLKEAPKQSTNPQPQLKEAPRSPVSNTEIDIQAALEDFAGYNEKSTKQTTAPKPLKEAPKQTANPQPSQQPKEVPKPTVSNTEIDIQAALEDFAGFNAKPTKQTTAPKPLKETPKQTNPQPAPTREVPKLTNPPQPKETTKPQSTPTKETSKPQPIQPRDTLKPQSPPPIQRSAVPKPSTSTNNIPPIKPRPTSSYATASTKDPSPASNVLMPPLPMVEEGVQIVLDVNAIPPPPPAFLAAFPDSPISIAAAAASAASTVSSASSASSPSSSFSSFSSSASTANTPTETVTPKDTVAASPTSTPLSTSPVRSSPIANTEIDIQAALEESAGYSAKSTKQTTTPKDNNPRKEEEIEKENSEDSEPSFLDVLLQDLGNNTLLTSTPEESAQSTTKTTPSATKSVPTKQGQTPTKQIPPKQQPTPQVSSQYVAIPSFPTSTPLAPNPIPSNNPSTSASSSTNLNPSSTDTSQSFLRIEHPRFSTLPCVLDEMATGSLPKDVIENISKSKSKSDDDQPDSLSPKSRNQQFKAAKEQMMMEDEQTDLKGALVKELDYLKNMRQRAIEDKDTDLIPSYSAEISRVEERLQKILGASQKKKNELAKAVEELTQLKNDAIKREDFYAAAEYKQRLEHMQQLLMKESNN